MKPDWKEKIANAPESFKARNPHLYQPVVGRVRSKVAESDRTREGEDPTMGLSAEVPCFCITITVYRKRLVDGHDNSRMACKALVDAITTVLGFDSDSDPRLEWIYHQIQSKITHGTHVIITKI